MIIYKLNRYLLHPSLQRCYTTNYEKFKPPWRVLFFGSDRFSLASLKALNIEYKKNSIVERLEIVTSFKNKSNLIYKYGIEEQLVVHRWPLDEAIKDFDVGLVVSFGYLLPENVINSFPLGMLNVHASLLPRWRGAAPIIYALANGDTKTGVSIMRIKPRHFDIGEIVDQSEINITESTTMPGLYETLAELGAQTLVKSLYNLPKNLPMAKLQDNLGATLAPKIDHNFGIVNFNKMSAREIYNLARSIESLYPLSAKFKDFAVKLYEIRTCEFKAINNSPGFIYYDKKDKLLKIPCSDGNFVSIKNIGVYNKKPISAMDFNNGYLKKEIENNKFFT